MFDGLPDSPAYAVFEAHVRPLITDWKVVHPELANP